VGQSNVANSTCNAAVTGSQKSSVPAGIRHPNFDLDVRVGGRRQCGRDPAKRRQIGEDLAIGCGVGPSRNQLSCCNRGVLQPQTEEARACRGGRQCRGDAERQVSSAAESTLAAQCRPLDMHLIGAFPFPSLWVAVILPACRPAGGQQKKWLRTRRGPSAPPNFRRPASVRDPRSDRRRSVCGLQRVLRRPARFRR